MSERIDAWTHILPAGYFERLQSLGSASGRLRRWLSLPALHDLDVRFRIMDAFPGYRQVLTPSLPPLEELAEAEEAAALARLYNDGLAELAQRHPDRFLAWVGALSLLDAEAAAREVERAVAAGACGFQIVTNIRGEPLDSPRFQPVFDAIARLGVPIWLHPARGPDVPDYAREDRSRFEIWWCFGWPYETSAAMARLVFSGLLDRHPTLRVLTHHMGAMIPYFAGRIEQGWGAQMGTRTADADADLLPGALARPPAHYLHMFYADTALSGSVAATRCGLDFFGAERCLFASDFPFDAEQGEFLVRATIAALDALGLDPATRAAIDHGNARAFLTPCPP